MKRYNDYFTFTLCHIFNTFSFFICQQLLMSAMMSLPLSLKNLLPSLLPFMILVSLCLNLGILDILAYFLQIPL